MDTREIVEKVITIVESPEYNIYMTWFCLGRQDKDKAIKYYINATGMDYNEAERMIHSLDEIFNRKI
jgi:hypothetical protein